ncbi:unnamed protein product [Urochloa humidicola]
MLRAADFMRCKARAYCGVDVSRAGAGASGGGEPSALRITLLHRTGARAFKDEAAVTRVFDKECKRVAGCAVIAAHANNLTFCEQVRLLSAMANGTTASPRGALGRGTSPACGEPQVADLDSGAAGGHKDVVRLDVAVDDPGAMYLLRAPQELPHAPLPP